MTATTDNGTTAGYSPYSESYYGETAASTAPTAVWFKDIFYDSSYYPEEEANEIAVISTAIINAVKATKTMVEIAKNYICRMPAPQFWRRPTVFRRIMFCKSGWVPKRIRRIRKSRG